MNRNPYSYTPAAGHGAATLPRSRALRIAQFVHIIVMVCQLGFWIWILYDQQTQWKNSTPLLLFFLIMVTMFGIAIVCDTLCLCRMLVSSEAAICMLSLVVCILLAVFMLGAHSVPIILAWLGFSLVWGITCLTRLKAVESRQSANGQTTTP